MKERAEIKVKRRNKIFIEIFNPVAA